MRLNCPHNLNQFLLGEPIFEDTFTEEDCEATKFYGDCFHCFSTAMARRDNQLKNAINKIREIDNDCISRQAVLNTLDNMDKALDVDRTVENYKQLLTECYKDLFPVKPKEKTGYWIDRSGGDPTDFSVSCNLCNKWFPHRSNFCPDCGAKMEDKAKI